MPVIVALGRLRQEDGKFEVSLGYIGRSCLKYNTHSLSMNYEMLHVNAQSFLSEGVTVQAQRKK
jgi:hypothetical protein